ncbi:hypothetical protein DAPPUDRAFT_314955 [Daphnia pulex]|uniref:Uncharacterized protein n=1 Tax=Daphnia pulex TaxID=6669 RepID=E9G878_DAPPU|nr:hypothetical protein DAPPUDRAFT_314955 [Daphnia pulex]|eukprot:EFX84322.1 hypothetical protein DAPPUDRAFT_314955 [Daphnia pulex]
MEDLFIHRRNESNDSNVNWYKTHPLATSKCRRKGEERPVCIYFIIEGYRDHYVNRVMQWCRDPSPSYVKMQKERPFFMSFIIEGHGDHYVKRVMQWCRGWVRTGCVASSSIWYNSRKA